MFLYKIYLMTSIVYFELVSICGQALFYILLDFCLREAIQDLASISSRNGYPPQIFQTQKNCKTSNFKKATMRKDAKIHTDDKSFERFMSQHLKIVTGRLREKCNIKSSYKSTFRCCFL